MGAMLETVLKRDRALVAAGLVALGLLAWAYMFYLARQMETMSDMAGVGMLTAWGPVDFVLMFLMRAVRMGAMMTPAAAPMLLTIAAIHRRRKENDNSRSPLVPTGVFLAGYLLVWSGFSLAATLAQWGLHTAALLSPMLSITGPVLGGSLLLLAGAFQWTPLKSACLRHCRTPLGFLTTDWREGYRGALGMGLKHGAWCLGCCWALMALLFVLGVMNLLWIATLAALVLAEKILPAGPWIARSAGLALLAWGLWLIIGGILA